MSRSARIWRLLITAILVVMAIAWLLPAVWVVVTSLKLTENIVRVPPEWIPWPVTIAHYGEVLFSSSRTARIGRAFLNSTVVSLGSVALVVLTSAMAAYPLARMRFRGRDAIFALLVGSLMIPNAVVLVPQYVLVQRLGSRTVAPTPDHQHPIRAPLVPVPAPLRVEPPGRPPHAHLHD